MPSSDKNTCARTCMEVKEGRGLLINTVLNFAITLLLLATNFHGEVPDDFIQYITSLHKSLIPPHTADDQWPPSATNKVLNLAMIKATKVRRGQIHDNYVRPTITEKVDDIL